MNQCQIKFGALGLFAALNICARLWLKFLVFFAPSAFSAVKNQCVFVAEKPAASVRSVCGTTPHGIYDWALNILSITVSSSVLN